MKSHGHDHTGDNVAAPNTEYAADGSQNIHQVGVQRAVASHVNTQIRVHAPSLCRHQATYLVNQRIIELADVKGRSGVEIDEPGFDPFPVGHVLGDIAGRFPAFIDDDGDHCLGKKGVGAGSHRKMNVGNGGGFTFSGIDHDKKPIRVFAEPGERFAGLWHLMAHHAVPAPANQHFGAMLIRYGDIILPAQHTSQYPPDTAELLAGGGIIVLGTHGPKQADAE